VEIPEFIRLIRAGQDREAQEVIKRHIPLPGALGRICPRYCERVCRRQEFDEPIAICALKRYPSEVDYSSAEPYLPAQKPRTGRSIGIVGAGPAGLSAAYYLLQNGHECTVVDAHAEPGGMLRYGIPDYRMPSDIVRREAELVEKLGAKFRLNSAVGTDVGFEELLRGHDVLLLATGSQGESRVELEGAELTKSGMRLLEEVAAGQLPALGESAAVLGDGDVAVAVARTMRRLGVSQVSILSESSRRRMSCIRGRGEEAEEEGVSLLCDAKPTSVAEIHHGLVVRYVVDGEERTEQVDTVVWAPRRRVDPAPAEALGLKFDQGRVSTDKTTMQTTRRGIFAAGELASGPGAAVRAVAAGRLAAVSIDQFLRGEEVVGEASLINVRMGQLTEEEKQAVFAGYERAPRSGPDFLPELERLSGFEEIEQALSSERSRREAGRCLECDCLAKKDCKLRVCGTRYEASVRRFSGECRDLGREDSHAAVRYESGKCILCGLCVRITEGVDVLGMTFNGRGFPTRTRVPFGRSVLEGLPDGLAERCADACPTGALERKRTNGRKGGLE
jgi:NADPH-dependent glutamate synthase beta subunit-like oxidoreductase/ferredoxin